MLLPRRSRYLIPSLLGLVTVIFLVGEVTITSTNAQSFNDGPPRYSYNKLPKTSFSCSGRLPGRYYPDPETDCQMFHVCVKMTNRDVQDFKFLCPNGTVFDSEHQVCIDYYQVVCQRDGTNPLGQIFEIFKLSSGQGNRGLDSGKLSFVNPDSIERNTLGDDFQVEEYNNNRLASSQNALNFRSSDPTPSVPRPTKSQKAKEDIFFNNKGFVPSTAFNSFPPSTRRTTTTTTTTTEAPSSSTPRRPSLETFESYETESFSGFIPTRNSFNNFGRPQQDPSPDFDASTEDFTTRDDNRERFRNTQVSTTARPLVFQNTFRTTLSHVPSTSRPSAQTFQQQATRFNDEYFTRIPSTTRRPVSKAAQFFIHSSTADDYFTPEYRQPTVNPFVNNRRSQSTTTTTSTTIRPKVVFQGNTGTVRPKFSGNPTTDFQYESTTTAAPPTTTTTTDAPTTTEYFGRYRQTEDDFETRQTTYSGFIPTTKNNFFNNNDKQRKDEEFGGKTSSQRNFPPQLSSQYVEEETLRPRNINGVSNAQNTLNSQPPPEVRPRDNFGFSTVPPPTTAEPFSTPPPTTAASAVTQQETAQTLAARLQGQLFKKITTTKNPEKYSIFFGRSTQSVGDDRLPAPGPTTVLYYDKQSTTARPRVRVRSTTANPVDYQQTSASDPIFDRRRGRSRFQAISSTVAPDQDGPSSSSQRPLRRGVRRRVRPGSRPRGGEGKTFDPQLKYTRRRFESARVNNEGGEQKTDEIFNAEPSVYRGDPSINNFFQEQRKGANSGSQKTNDKIDQAQQEQPRQRQPVNQYEQNFGRRVRPNGGGDAQHIDNGEEPRRPPLPPGSQGQIRRRVVKRLRPKNGTVTTNTNNNQPDGETPKKSFVVTGSTLRPVTRINIKTRLGGKISTTYRTTEITDGSSSPTPSSTTTTTTTEEPELITASDVVVEEKRQRNHESSSSTTVRSSTLSHSGPFTKKPFPSNNFNNDSHLVIKVISEKPFSPSPSFPTSPLSIKKPILNGPRKKFGKPAGGGGNKNSSKSSTNNNDEESQTKSPDYDYAYYNSDDPSDYDAETSKLDHKNYGKKPKNSNNNGEQSN